MSTDRAAYGADTGDAHAGLTSSRALFVLRHERRDGFWANIRGHVLDLADPNPGHVLAPEPDDLFIVSIASELAWTVVDGARPTAAVTSDILSALQTGLAKRFPPIARLRI